MRLEIVVAPDCCGCEEARTLAREVQARYPSVEVNLIELDGRRQPPAGVVATPTYLIDGEVVFLGNPRRETLARAIAHRQTR